LNYIEIAVTNILSNAIKFSYSNGKIEISDTNEDNEFTILIITDYGTGMDDKTYNDLFKIDKIHSNYGTEKETGNGMGLLVSRRIINEIDGKLKIITKPNHGTSVQIYTKKR